MTDLTLEDLAGHSEPSAASESGGVEVVEETTDESGGGDWLIELFDRLDEKGLIEPLMFGADGMTMGQGEQPVPSKESDSEASAASQDIDADDLARFGKLVLDNAGDLQISEVVKMAEKRPETVNQLIERAL